MNVLIGDEIVISKMRGKWIEKKFGNCKTSVIVTFHPAFNEAACSEENGLDRLKNDKR